MIPWVMIGRNAVGVVLGVRKRRAELRHAGVDADMLELTAQEVGQRAGEVTRNIREQTIGLAEASSEKLEEMRGPVAEAAKRGIREAEKIARDPSEFAENAQRVVSESGKRVGEVVNASGEEWAERGERTVQLARESGQQAGEVARAQKKRLAGAFRTLRNSFRGATGKSGDGSIE